MRTPSSMFCWVITSFTDEVRRRRFATRGAATAAVEGAGRVLLLVPDLVGFPDLDALMQVAANTATISASGSGLRSSSGPGVVWRLN